MRQIRDILGDLKKEQKEYLFYCFEYGIYAYVEYEEGRFIGVNVERDPGLQICQRVNHWSEGKIENGKNKQT